MKLIEAITTVNKIKPNAYDNASLLYWINQLDAMVQSSVMKVPKEDIVDYTLPDDADTELFIGKPYEDCYITWLSAQIDFANQETASYENHQAKFNYYFGEYEKHYNREHPDTAGLKIHNIW